MTRAEAILNDIDAVKNNSLGLINYAIDLDNVSVFSEADKDIFYLYIEGYLREISRDVGFTLCEQILIRKSPLVNSLLPYIASSDITNNYYFSLN